MKRNVIGVQVTVESIIQFCQTWRQLDVVRLPQYQGIPEDAEIMAVYWLPDYNCFMVAMYHESFEEVPQGTQIPMKMPGYDMVGLKEFDTDDRAILASCTEFIRLVEKTLSLPEGTPLRELVEGIKKLQENQCELEEDEKCPLPPRITPIEELAAAEEAEDGDDNDKD